MKKKFRQIKKHWFLISLNMQINQGEIISGCVNISKNNINITSSDFNYVKELAENYNSNSNIIAMHVVSISYLGYMTDNEFNS